jgi:hypothetical protein
MAAKQHGTARAYRGGCGCEPCKDAYAAYRRQYRARKKRTAVTVAPVSPTALSDATVTSLRPAPAPVVGVAEQAVIDELTSLSSAVTRLSDVQGAIAMARILDNPNAISNQAAAQARLQNVMESLRKGSDRKKGRLASVQSMTRTTGTDA